MEYSASLMCANLLNLANDFDRLKVAGINRIHYDIMDGNFVPNVTLGLDMAKDFIEYSNMKFDAHLMVKDPASFIDKLIDFRFYSISFHIESNPNNVFRLIDKIKAAGIKAGIVLSPVTSVESIKYLLPRLDLITVMTVDPGFAGQKFVKEALFKFDELDELRKKFNYNFDLMIDGSVNEKTIEEITSHPVDILILGSSGLFGDKEGFEKALEKLNKLNKRYLTK
jgi:ribulose-phosphate 3-epimerase